MSLNSPEAAPDANVHQGYLTKDECLQCVLRVLPDIAVEHAQGFIESREAPGGRTAYWCQLLIGSVLDEGPYPKERDERTQPKRKRSSHDLGDSIREDEALDRNQQRSKDYLQLASKALRHVYLDVPVKHINGLLKEQSLFDACLTLDHQTRNYSNSPNPPFCKVNKPRRVMFHPEMLHEPQTSAQREVAEELCAAKQKCAADEAKRIDDQHQNNKDEADYHQAQLASALLECQCCFDEQPASRMVVCNGERAHFFCRDCAQKYVDTEMSLSRCRPTCFAGDDCNAEFAREQLRSFMNPTSFDRLESLQQQEDIAAAGIENLEQCPFCNFQAECAPVEQDFEFRCQSTDCGKTSCRLCRLESHVPLSCQEAQKDNKIAAWHAVEEAMTQALVRTCNVCKSPFIKEDGCNKMTCPKPHCRNVQCYICSKSVKDYEHFSRHSQDTKGLCPLFDNTEQRHKDDVKKAETQALALLRAEHPEVPEEDVKVHVSSGIKNEDKKRAATTAARPHFPMEDVLRAEADFRRVLPQVHNQADMPRPLAAAPVQAGAPYPPANPFLAYPFGMTRGQQTAQLAVGQDANVPFAMPQYEPAAQPRVAPPWPPQVQEAPPWPPQLRAAQPGVAQPWAAQLQAAQPGFTQLWAAQPQAAQPGAAQPPYTAQPRAAR